MIQLTQLLTEAIETHLLSEHLKDHMNRNVPLIESIFRYNSDAWRSLVNEVRDLHHQGKITLTNEEDLEFIETDAGTIYEHNGNTYYLDIPMLEEEDVTRIISEESKAKKGKNADKELNKPKRNTGSGKKYVVYVKDPSTGNVKKITFGDAKGGLTAKINDPEARAAFSKRHNCPAKKDKLTPGYWACRLPRYAKSLGLAGSYSGYW